MTLSGVLRLAQPFLMLLGRLRRRLPRWMHRPGVVGIVFTSGGQTVLVRHSYLPGWFPPGGGRKRGESAHDAVIRELGEEIGLQRWSSLTPVEQSEAGLDVFVVRDATFSPRRSIEIAEVATFAPDRLPIDTSPRLRRLLAIIEVAEAWNGE